MKFRLIGRDFRIGKGPVNEATVTKDGEVLTLTKNKTLLEPTALPFLNETFGNQMNQNVTFSGTPELVHDGIDTVAYTGSGVAGSFTFNSTAHCHQGICTIVDYNIIDAGETVTITVQGVQSVLTAGGTDWTASVNNATTATSLAAAIDGVSGVSASATLAVVTVLADSTNDITELVTSGTAGELLATGQSVLSNNNNVGDIMQFAKGSDLTLSNFAALTMQIFVDSDWASGDSIELYGYDTDLSLEVGVRFPLEDLFMFDEFDTWHPLAVSLADLEIAAATTVDAFRIQVVTRDGAKSPKYHIDQFQIEQTGAPVPFVLSAPVNRTFHIKEVIIGMADDVASTVANGTMPGLSYDKLLGVSSLSIGITFRQVQQGVTTFAVTLQELGDFLGVGFQIRDSISDGTNTFVTLLVTFFDPIIISGAASENFLSFTINDNVSGLLQYTTLAAGSLVIEDN